MKQWDKEDRLGRSKPGESPLLNWSKRTRYGKKVRRFSALTRSASTAADGDHPDSINGGGDEAKAGREGPASEAGAAAGAGSPSSSARHGSVPAAASAVSNASAVSKDAWDEDWTTSLATRFQGGALLASAAAADSINGGGGDGGGLSNTSQGGSRSMQLPGVRISKGSSAPINKDIRASIMATLT